MRTKQPWWLERLPKNIEAVCLLSYPRSGSNWVQYMIDKALGISPIKKSMMNTMYRSTLILPKKKYIIKLHGSESNGLDYDFDKLILVIRNPKEAIPRQHDYPGFAAFQHALEKNPEKAYSYVLPIIYYQKFPRDKLLLYYEDLLEDIEKPLHELKDFLGIDKDTIPEFIDKLGYHQTTSKGRLKRTPVSNDAPIFHSKKFSASFKLMIDQALLRKWPGLTRKYLVKYLEPMNRIGK